jgi:hypothetical protein
MTQRQLGIRLGIAPENAQQNISNMKRAAPDSELELHWQQSLKLQRICREIGIDPARDLEKPSPAEVILDVQRDADKTRKAVKTRKAGIKKASARSVS